MAMTVKEVSMQFNTARFGPIEVDEDKIINVPDGLIGFKQCRTFVIINIQKYKPFLWLQSLEDGSLCFVMTDPWQFFTDYSPELSDEDVGFLEIDNPSSVAIYTLISFSGDINNTRFNLLAPLCINHKTSRARQVILNNSNYSVACSLNAQALKDTMEQKPVEQQTIVMTEQVKVKMLIK
jgi:flagellar assembly factor FliW